MFIYTYRCAKLLYCLYRVFYNETDENIQTLKLAANKCGLVGNKFLQFITMYDGFLSAEGKKHFGYVFENCATHKWEDTCKMYEQDFGRFISDDYELKNDSSEVIGSGSIGQVYRLWSKSLNHYVAVKVKHPGVDIETLQFIHHVTKMLTVLEYIITLPFSFLLREFLSNIKCQLDYTQEAKNTQKLKQLYEKEECIIVPEVYNHSSRFIVMDYFEGTNFNELKIEDKKFIACNMFLFLVTSLLCHDFLHCDLHYGNWKITEDKKIIVYDCGIVGSTHNPSLNKEMVLLFKDGNFTGMSNLLLTDKDKKLKEKITIKENQKYENSTDRVTDIVKDIILQNTKINIDVFRCMQGFSMCLGTIKLDVDKLSRIIGSDIINRCLVICYYHGIAKKLNRYQDYCTTLEKWMEEDPTIEETFYNWLDDSFGHRDKDVFIEVMVKHMLPSLTV